MRNAVAGAAMYPVMISMCLVATDLDTGHPAMAYGVLCTITLISLLRIVMARRFTSWSPAHRQRLMTAFNIGGLASAGLFTSLSLLAWHGYGLDSTALVFLLMSGGLGAGSVLGVCMNMRLSDTFLAVTLVPLAVYGLTAGTTESFAIGCVYVAYIAMLHRFAVTGSHAYWDAAIATAMLRDKADQLEFDVATVLQSTQAVTQARTHGAVVDGVLTCALEHAGSDQAFLFLHRDDDLWVIAKAPQSSASYTLPLPLTQAAHILPVALIQRVFDEGSPLSVPNTGEIALGDTGARNAPPPRSLLILPVIAHGRALGVLYLENRHAPLSLTPKRVEVLQILAGQAAISLENADYLDKVTAQERWLSTTLSSISDAVITTGTDDLVTFCNPVALSILGWGHGSPLGKRLDELLILEDLETPFDDPKFNSLRDHTLHTHTGKSLTIACSASPIVGDDGISMGTAVVFRDITGERATEAQLQHRQRMESVGRLAGGVAHDFNNLLTVILNCSEDLNRRLKAGADRNDAEQIIAAGRRAESLTRQLLAFSRQQVLTPKNVNLNLIVKDMLSMLERLVQANVEIRTDLDPSIGTILVDEGQLGQVILNLVVNAADAMPEGGTVCLKTKNTALKRNNAVGCPPGTFVSLEVSDEGVGMDKTALQRAFEPFFTTKGPGKGTGLGLSTVHGIVRQSHGHVLLASELGQGTTVSIFLPMSHSRTLSPRQALENSTPAKETTILLLDEDKHIRKLTTHILKSDGYTVISAQSKDLKDMPPDLDNIDLLLTDVTMPRRNGYRVAQSLIRERPLLKVLFMSGYAPDQVLDTTTAHFLSKPFTPQQLKTKVREVLR